MNALNYRASRCSSSIAVGASSVVIVLLGSVSAGALLLGIFGLLSILLGLRRASRTWISVGIVWFGLAVIAAVFYNASVEVVGISILAGTVTWDAANRGISIGQQLTRAAETYRVELLHSGVTVVIGVGSFGVGYSIYISTSVTYSILAITALSACIVILLFVISYMESNTLP